MSSKSALGRGLDSLIPVDLEVGSVASPGEQIKKLSLDKIFANPDQPRKEFDEAALNELASSIKRHGIIQPIVVTPAGGKFRIIAGERRYRASIIAKLRDIPAIVRNHEELEELEIALVENVQRVDLSPLEQAVSVVRLRDQFSLSIKEIAKRLGKAETTVINIVRLLQLPKEAVNALQKGKISEGHARAILALRADESLQKKLLESIIEGKLSVRAAEKLVKDLKNDAKPAVYSVSKNIAARAQIAEKTIGLKTVIKPSKKGGSLSIAFTTEDELSRILDRLTDTE